MDRLVQFSAEVWGGFSLCLGSMNKILTRIALAGATSAYNAYRNSDKKKQRELYDALVDAVKEGKLGDVADKANIDQLEDLASARRAEAGDVTRDIHDRLDRRRAAFAAAAPDRKARREALKYEAKQREKKNSAAGFGKFIGTVLAIAGTAAGAWAFWEYWLSEKLEERKEEPKVYRPAPTRTETDDQGRSTLVYSTRTEDARGASGARISNDPDNDLRPDADMRGAAGPLGEEPAERDEALLSSIDEQLTTMDTLEDDQRKATDARHTNSDVLGDTGSGGRSDKTSDADTTIGASGRHELRKDQDQK